MTFLNILRGFPQCMKSLFYAVELKTTSKELLICGVSCLWGPSPEQMHGLGLAALVCPLVVPVWIGLVWDLVQGWLKGLYWSWKPVREGHFPALQASLLSVHPQSLFLRLIKALWNLDSFLFSFLFLHFSSVLFLQDTVLFILLALWWFSRCCIEVYFGAK